MSLLKQGLKLANKLSESDNSNVTNPSLESTLAEGVGRIHIPNGYVKNIAAKYFLPDAPKDMTGCLNKILGKKEPPILITEQQFDSFKQTKIDSLIEKGMSKLNISTNDLIKKPDVIYGPYWYEIPENVPLEHLEIMKKGNDGKVRYVFFSIGILFYTEKQLLAYVVKYDIVLEQIINASSEEYFYKDLIGVTSDEESFRVKTTGGSSIEVEFQKPAYRKYKIDNSDAESAVSNIRKILREVKS